MVTDSLLAAAAADPSALQSVIDFFQDGGFFMIPLGIASMVGVSAIFYKFLSLGSARVVPAELEGALAVYDKRQAAGRTGEIDQRLRAGQSVLARLANVVVRQRGKSQAEINQVVEAAAREETVRLHAGIGTLDVVITLAPLLGLLGTASGLVTIFEGLGDTTDYVSIAKGIAVALNTTIAGLAIAVPCVIAHSYFTRRIERIGARLEMVLSELVQVCQGRPDPGDSH